MSLIEEKEEENKGLEESDKGSEERDERPEDRYGGLDDTDERKEERNESKAGRDDVLEDTDERKEERNKSETERSKSKEERSESKVERNISMTESEKGMEEGDGGLEEINEIKEERSTSQTERNESKAEKNKSKEERKEEILSVSEVGHRSQEILDSLRKKHLEGLRQSNLAEGCSLTYHAEEEKITRVGTKHMSDAAKYKFGYNPKFRFKAVVRLVMSNTIWMLTSHGEEKRPDDFAFNLRLLRKKKGQLSLLSFKEKMALLKRPSSRTDEEIEMLAKAFSNIKCLKGYSRDIHEELAKAAVLYCFRPNREVMRKGNQPTGLYLITSGEAATLKLHLDPLTLVPSLVPTGSIIPGQIFGELPLLFNQPRTISVITMTSCETVFWHKEFFDKFLLEAAKKKSETIRKIVSHFTSFSNWDEESLRRLSTKAYIYTYPKDSAILGESIGEKETIHLIVNGVCSIIQRLDMIHGIKDNRASITPYPAKKGDIPPGFFLRTHFLDVAHLRKGMACNLGESWKDRVLMALNDVTILYIPYNVVEEYDARDSSWDEIAKFIQTSLPDEETLYAEYMKKVKWRDYREKFREDVIFQNKESKKSMIRHIPINITHLLEKEDIK